MNTNKKSKEPTTLPVTLQIGKSYVTPELVAELERQLKQRKTVKIKILPSAFPEHPTKKERRALAAVLAEKTGALVVRQVGFTVIFHKR